EIGVPSGAGVGVGSTVLNRRRSACGATGVSAVAQTRLASAPGQDASASSVAVVVAAVAVLDTGALAPASAVPRPRRVTGGGVLPPTTGPETVPRAQVTFWPAIEQFPWLADTDDG